MQDNVTQADRDAYANEVEKFVDKEYADLIRAGQRDKLSMLQAFAAHRLASTAQPEVKALVEALERIEAGAAEHLRPGQKGYIDRRGIRGICRKALAAYHEAQP